MPNLTPAGGPQTVVVEQSGGTVLQPAVLNAYGSLTIPAFFRAVSLLAGTLARLPRSVRKNNAAPADDEDMAHPLDPVLRREPNRTGVNPMNLWRTWFFHGVHRGNGYIRVERDPVTFRPVALHTLLPNDVTPYRVLFDGELAPETWYAVRRADGELEMLPAADVLHIQTLGFDGVMGTDPTALHEATLQRASMLNRYMTKYLSSGTNIKMSIEFPADKVVPDERIARIVNQTLPQFRGVDGGRDTLVLTDGAQLKNQTVSPQQSQLIEQARHATKEIAQITGVPPELLYEQSEAKYNDNVEQMGQHVVRYTLGEWIEQAEDELTLKLLTPGERADGYAIHLNVKALIRGDTKAETDNAVSLKDAGITSENESRRLVGLPRREDPAADRPRAKGDTAPQAGGASGGGTSGAESADR